MDPTSLPTDNLYKFMALAGLAFTGFCGWLFWRMADARRKQQTTVGEEVARLQGRLDTARARSNQLALENTTFSEGSTTGNEASRAFYARELLKVRDEIAANAALVGAIGEECNAASARLRGLRENRGVLAAMVGTGVGGIVGLAIAAIGFLLWQDRLQRFADEQTRIELQLKRLELERKLVEAKPAPASSGPSN